jgi:nucleoside-diphosphate-sugar epimerase
MAQRSRSVEGLGLTSQLRKKEYKLSESQPRILVTGHAGYIGSVMVPFLLEAGYDVVGLDTFFFEGCDFGNGSPAVPTLRKDIRDVTAADLQACHAVIHLAALCNDPLGELNPELTMAINHKGSVDLARMAKDAGVRRFLYSSSCSMYGAAGVDPVTEDAPLRPLTAYAESKVRAEEDISKLEGEGFSPVFMRNATAYGASPRLRADVVLNNLVGWGFTTGCIRIMSDGTPWRPIVHVEDISYAFLASLQAPVEQVHNQSFNVGSNGENYQVKELADIARESLSRCTIEYSGKAGTDPRSYRVDFDKFARHVPAFKPRWNARRGAEQLLSGFRTIGMRNEDFHGRRFNRLAQFKHLLASGRLDPTLRWNTGGAR